MFRLVACSHAHNAAIVASHVFAAEPDVGGRSEASVRRVGGEWVGEVDFGGDVEGSAEEGAEGGVGLRG